MARAEYFKYRLWRPGLDDPGRLTYTSQRERRLSEVATNPRVGGRGNRGKTEAQELFAGHDLPGPELLGQVDLEPARAAGRPGVLRTVEGFAALLEERGRLGVVIKPEHGMQGDGIIVLVESGRDGGALVSGAALSVGELWARLRAHGSDGRWRIERRVVPHPLLAGFRAGTTPTVRLLTLRVDGGVVIHAATLKVPRGDSGVDNLARGNLVAAVDLETGRVGHATDGTGLPVLDQHPDSAVPIRGMVVPHWQGVRRVACLGAALFDHWRAIGWDVAVTADGPVVLEANIKWCEKLLQLPVDRGLTHGAMIRLLDEVGAGHLLAARRRHPGWQAFEAGEAGHPFQRGTVSP